MRRGPDDLEWKKTKELVRKRDNNKDRILKVLTLQEGILLNKKARSLMRILDPAHYLPVSSHPELIYDYQNICLLNRWSHSNLDSYKDPITGNPISKEEVQAWWERIIKGNPDQYKYLKEKELI